MSGFSMLELLVALAVAAILFAMAAPDFADLMRSNRQRVALQRLDKTLAVARDRAIMTNTPVSVCASGSGQSCTDTEWDLGWMVFDDGVNPGVVDPTEPVLLVAAELGGDIHIAADPRDAIVSYLPDGTTRDPGRFLVCDGRGSSAAQSLCIERTGLLRSGKLDCDGAPITCP